MKKYILISIGLVIAIILLLKMCKIDAGTTSFTEEPVHETDTIAPVMEYGLPIDSFNVVAGKIRPNENLASILLNQGVPTNIINQLSRCADTFDVRKIRSGNTYKMFLSNDSLRTPIYFAYEHTLTDYVLISLTDTIAISLGSKPIKTITKTATGTINSNLWSAMSDNQINPVMSIELSEIYAWVIDFFGLQKGDQFYVVYDEDYIQDTLSVGIRKVHAALFRHQNNDYYAYYFEQDGIPSYFDENGQSLRRAFLKAPLKYSRISSRYSSGRMHPILKIRRPHYAVDYAAPSGTPVFAIGDGFVVSKGFQGNGAGNYVKIKHNSVYTTQYAHLSSFAKGLSQGDRVIQGQLVGYVGSTGLSSGPHLDFRVFKNGSPVDPLKLEAPPVEPVKPENRETFKQYLALYHPRLLQLQQPHQPDTTKLAQK